MDWKKMRPFFILEAGLQRWLGEDQSKNGNVVVLMAKREG